MTTRTKNKYNLEIDRLRFKIECLIDDFNDNILENIQNDLENDIDDIYWRDDGSERVLTQEHIKKIADLKADIAELKDRTSQATKNFSVGDNK
jgi:hypothetical protein